MHGTSLLAYFIPLHTQHFGLMRLLAQQAMMMMILSITELMSEAKSNFGVPRSLNETTVKLPTCNHPTWLSVCGHLWEVVFYEQLDHRRTKFVVLLSL